MNKEQKKAKKTAKIRKRRRTFLAQQEIAKVKKDRILKKEKIAYKFDKLKKKLEREKYAKKHPPVISVPTAWRQVDN